MKNRIAHIISKSISHNLKRLYEGYFDDMFDNNEENTKCNDLLPNINQERLVNDLTYKSLLSLEYAPITPLFLNELGNNGEKMFKLYLNNKLPSEVYNKETHRYEIKIIANTLSTAYKWSKFISSLSISDGWSIDFNNMAPIQSTLNVYCADDCYYVHQCLDSGPGNDSIYFIDFNKNTTNNDISNYIRDHLNLYIDNDLSAIKRKYVNWLTKYKKFISGCNNSFFDKLITQSNLYEYCRYSPSHGIAVTAQIQYTDTDDIIYTVDEINDDYMYIKQCIKRYGQIQNYNYRQIQYIYTIQFTNEYNYEKELKELDIAEYIKN